MKMNTAARAGWLLSVSIGFMTSCSAFGATATVSLSPPRDHTLTGGPHAGHLYREQQADFDFGPTFYSIAYKACIDKAHGDKVVPLEGYIGMPRPSADNWYHSGFLFISLNGQDIGTTPLSSMLAPESGSRAILDMVWHHELANVRVRFCGLPGHDYLGCEIAIEPHAEIKSVEIKLLCYPSYFTAFHHRDGARVIKTPDAVIKQGPAVTKPAADNWWALYEDEIFDVAKGEGDGPCGMLFLPDHATNIRFEPGSYAVVTRINFTPDTRRIRMAFWDFSGVTNADALKRLSGGAAAVRAELAAQRFTPESVQNLDVPGARAMLERIVKLPSATPSLKKRAQDMLGWLDVAPLHPDFGGDPPPIALEERLLQSIDQYTQISWEGKLAELVATF